MLVDSHCHLDSKEFDSDREETIERALAAGVKTMLAIGTGEGPPDLEAGIRLADRYDCFYATVGVHPHEAAKATPEILARLSELLAHPKVVAVGEIGLDYHYDFSPREQQRAAFIEQMEIAAERGKPIVIHTREAWEDTLGLIERHWAGSDRIGIMHCFSGGPAEAAQAVELGFYLSFGGIVTYPKATAVHEAARTAPLESLLLETDSPYLAPVPRRGKRNEPALLVHTARRIADLRGMAVEELGEITTNNFERLRRLTTLRSALAF